MAPAQKEMHSPTMLQLYRSKFPWTPWGMPAWFETLAESSHESEQLAPHSFLDACQGLLGEEQNQQLLYEFQKSNLFLT